MKGFFQSWGPIIFFLRFLPKILSAGVYLISVSFLISPPVNNSNGINLSLAKTDDVKIYNINVNIIFFIFLEY